MFRSRLLRIVFVAWLMYGVVIEIVAPPPRGEFPPRLRSVEVPPEVQEVIARAVSQGPGGFSAVETKDNGSCE